MLARETRSKTLESSSDSVHLSDGPQWMLCEIDVKHSVVYRLNSMQRVGALIESRRQRLGKGGKEYHKLQSGQGNATSYVTHPTTYPPDLGDEAQLTLGNVQYAICDHTFTQKLDWSNTLLGFSYTTHKVSLLTCPPQVQKGAQWIYPERMARRPAEISWMRGQTERRQMIVMPNPR